MAAKARVEKHLLLTVDDAVGRLHEVTAKLQAAGVDIRSVVTWTEGPVGHMILGTADLKAARGALAGLAKTIRDQDMLVIRSANKPGALHKVAARIAEGGIAIFMAAATASGEDTVTFVLSTADNARAAELF